MAAEATKAREGSGNRCWSWLIEGMRDLVRPEVPVAACFLKEDKWEMQALFWCCNCIVLPLSGCNIKTRQKRCKITHAHAQPTI